MAKDKPQGEDGSLGLALAVVASSTAPLLLLDGDFRIVAASASFCQTFQMEAADTIGRTVFELSRGEWEIPQLHSLLEATLSGAAQIEAYEMDLRAGGELRRLVLKARRLSYGEDQAERLLLTIFDVTDARASDKHKDDLVREKTILLQEVQHRVANSLQIISSVILQSARRVQSAESRGHLREAHERVMSVAEVQRQLAASTLSDVHLEDYFGQLCRSLGASMISDHDQIVLEVVADDSWVPATISVSLGLIVTELVINALKHAFPGGRKGRIVVGYHADAAGWTLSVADNGVGIPTDPDSARGGLGTNIVLALATQLDAKVTTAAAHPGTRISVVGAAPMAQSPETARPPEKVPAP
jgi:PAS domain S-box-containing protein